MVLLHLNPQYNTLNEAATELTTFPSGKMCLTSPLKNVTVFVFLSAEVTFPVLLVEVTRSQLFERGCCIWGEKEI